MKNNDVAVAAPMSRDDVLQMLIEARKWQAEGEFGDPISREYWSPAYRDFMDRLDGMIAALRSVEVQQPVAWPFSAKEGGLILTRPGHAKGLMMGYVGDLRGAGWSGLDAFDLIAAYIDKLESIVFASPVSNPKEPAQEGWPEVGNDEIQSVINDLYFDANAGSVDFSRTRRAELRAVALLQKLAAALDAKPSDTSHI